MSEGAKAIFLDRDGTINVDKNYLFRKEDFEYIPGAVEGLRILSEKGYLLIIITNQSGIGRGLFTEQEYLKLDKWMKEDLMLRGIPIAGSYYCPHLPDAKVMEYRCECGCRKPRTELFWRAKNDFNIDMSQSFAIGDKVRDLAICSESDVKGILLSEDEKSMDGIIVCSSWNEIVKYIC